MNTPKSIRLQAIEDQLSNVCSLVTLLDRIQVAANDLDIPEDLTNGYVQGTLATAARIIADRTLKQLEELITARQENENAAGSTSADSVQGLDADGYRVGEPHEPS